MARELINRIQNLRKETGLEITDRINVTVAPNEETDAAIEAFADYIKGQVLADSIEIGDNAGVETEHASLLVDQGICGFPWSLSHEAFPQGYSTCHHGVSRSSA